MARVVMVGGGVVGLCGAMLLARDGHDVTVFERDPASPCEPAEAWATWERRGVNQFRQPHFLLPRFRELLDTELPDVSAAIDASGALRYNIIDGLPDSVTGGRRDGDDRFELVTARRPVLECAIARAAAATEGCDVRRGVAVRALHTAGDAARRVDGVVPDGDDVEHADVVIDCGGRRSAMAAMIAEAGFREPVEDRHDLGFVYYGRHFRSSDGALPPAFGPLLQHYDSLSVGTLPADNGHWSIILVASGNDRAARALRDTDVWFRVVRAYPLVAHWGDGEPIDDGVQFMGAIEDRYRHFCPDGAVTAPGVLPLGDAFACTNPSVGRGISIGLMHAVALRDLLRDADTGDAEALSLAWDRATEAEVGRYVRDTLRFDGHRLAQIEAQMAGMPEHTDDPQWRQYQLLLGHGPGDPDLLRAMMHVSFALGAPSDVLARADVTARLEERELEAPLQPLPGPGRGELLGLLGA